jgi:hypothetical protein
VLSTVKAWVVPRVTVAQPLADSSAQSAIAAASRMVLFISFPL